MSKLEVLQPIERQVVSRRLSIKISKVSGAIAFGLGAGAVYAGRFSTAVICGLWAATALSTAISGYFRQGNLPPIFRVRDGDQ